MFECFINELKDSLILKIRAGYYSSVDQLYCLSSILTIRGKAELALCVQTFDWYCIYLYQFSCITQVSVGTNTSCWSVHLRCESSLLKKISFTAYSVCCWKLSSWIETIRKLDIIKKTVRICCALKQWLFDPARWLLFVEKAEDGGV